MVAMISTSTYPSVYVPEGRGGGGGGGGGFRKRGDAYQPAKQASCPTSPSPAASSIYSSSADGIFVPPSSSSRQSFSPFQPRPWWALVGGG